MYGWVKIKELNLNTYSTNYKGVYCVEQTSKLHTLYSIIHEKMENSDADLSEKKERIIL